MATTRDLDRLKFYDKDDRPWPGARLTSAAIVGHTTATSTRLWIRVWEPGEYCLFLSESPISSHTDPQSVDATTLRLTERGSGQVSALSGHLRTAMIGFETDLTHVFDVDSLQAGTKYHYAVFRSDVARSEPWEIGRDFPHAFRTPDASSDRSSFGLYSCHMPFVGRDVRNLHMWESFHEALSLARADFVIGAGDQVYSDGDSKVSIWAFLKSRKAKLAALGKAHRVEVMLSWYRDIYRGYWGDRAVRRVLRDFPNYMIWDDHEIMDGWGSYTDDELSDHLDTIWEWENKRRNLALARSMFKAAKRAYFEYEHSHNPPTPKGHWDYSFDASPGLRFFVLDMRGKRDFNRDGNRVLGKRQMERLEKWLDDQASDDTARCLFIVSPVPVVHLCDFIANTADLPLLGLADDLRDEWEHESNWEERDRMLDRVFTVSHATNKRVVFLSGDVHIAAAFRLRRVGAQDARVYQLTSSGITYAKAPGGLLQLAVREKGTLGHVDESPARPATTFVRLHIFAENNFGLVHADRRADGGVDLAWDLYGSSGRQGEIVKLRRVNLP